MRLPKLLFLNARVSSWFGIVTLYKDSRLYALSRSRLSTCSAKMGRKFGSQLVGYKEVPDSNCPAPNR